MIYTEEVTMYGKQYQRTYSDKYRIVRDGMEYDEAIDPICSGRTYTESETLKELPMTETEEKAAAYDILMGVTE